LVPRKGRSLSTGKFTERQVLSLNGYSAGKGLQLANGAYFDAERNSTAGGPPALLPETLESRSRFVDSDQKWHFDSLPVAQDAAPERYFNTDLGRDDIGHDLIYDR
jgi:hypothetical protein